MPPRAIYFDIGNVLLAFSHERMCEQMGKVAGVAPHAVWDFLFENHESAQIQWQYEVGQIDTDAYFEYFCRTMSVRPDRAKLEEAVCDIFEVIEGMDTLVHRLGAAGNRLGLLSNTNPLQWLYFTDGRFPLLALPGRGASPFTYSMLSFEVRAMKPDRRIYEAAAERAGVACDEIFFVDDREENVAGAVEDGIDGVLYRGVDALINDLRSRGVPGA